MKKKFLPNCWWRWTALLLAGLLVSCSSRQVSVAETPVAPSETYASEILMILNQRAQTVMEMLGEPAVIDAVLSANENHKSITPSKIRALDKKWQAADRLDGFIMDYIQNDCGRELQRFQKQHHGFAEIFVTDEKGLNVCQTNKTSDIYQADEDWWQKSFAGGKGEVRYDLIEYDESANSRSISLFVPVRATGAPPHAVGVAKAVVDITSLKREL